MAYAPGLKVARITKGLALGIFSLIAIGLLLLATLWWWAGTDGSLPTALRWANSYAPQLTKNLQVQNPTGSLRKGGHMDRVQWQQDGLSVDARDVRLSWQAWALASGTLRFDSLTMASLQIDDQRTKAAPSAPPESLQLPLRVVLNTFAVEQLAVKGGAVFSASGIKGRYSFDEERHQLEVTAIKVASGDYRAQLSLQASKPFAIDASLAGALTTLVPNSQTTLPLTFDAAARGTLIDLTANAFLRISTGTAATTATKKITAAQPNASITARITPWAAQPMAAANAIFQNLDAAALWPDAPRTQLTGSASVAPITSTGSVVGTATTSWTLQLRAANSLPGAWDKQRLPINQLDMSAEWRDGLVVVKSLNAQLAGGSLVASGQAEGTQTISFQALLKNINPRELHSQLAALPGSSKVQGKVKGTWSTLAGTGTLDLPTLELRSREAELVGALQAQPAALAGKANLNLKAPGLNASIQGDLRKTSGKGDATMQIQNAALALRWLQQLPMMPFLLKTAAAAGNGDMAASWQGGWQDPAVQMRLTVPALDVTPGNSQPAGSTPTQLRFRAVESAVSGRLSQATVTASGRLESGQRRYAVQTAFDAGKTSTTWQGLLKQFSLRVDDPSVTAGTWQLVSSAPVALKWTIASKAFESSAGQAQLTAPTPGAPALIAWQPMRLQAGQFTTAGKISGLPMAWIELFTGSQTTGAGLTGNLVFDGQWDAKLGDTLAVKASLSRTSGDITVQPDRTQGSATRIVAGVRQASVNLDSKGDAVNLSVRWDSERAGTLDGQLKTRLSKSAAGSNAGSDAGSNAGEWQWAPDAPLEGKLKAQLPRVGVWSVLAPPGWRLRGSLGADIVIKGTRAAPQLAGDLQANDLALRSVVDGIEFGNGRLRATLDGSRMQITEFTLQGAGDKGTGGTFSAQGVAAFVNGQASVSLDAKLDRLRASLRTDRQITLSGNVAARLQNNQTQLTGNLTVDQALFILPEDTAPRLGSDVVVRGASAKGAESNAKAEVVKDVPVDTTKPARALQLGIDIDLGQNLRIRGKGLDTLVQGKLVLSGTNIAQPRLVGAVNTVRGTYRAYGQQLDVERGVLRFTGALDNPTLDVLAIRPNLAQAGQRVGVQILGTALLPRVSLYAQPDMPEAEKLSWLVLGRSSASGGGEAALLQQAAVALLGSKSGGASGGLAGSFGLDELSYRSGSSNADGTASAGAVTLGKRFSRNFYAAYERSVSGAVGTLFVFYDLSQRFTLRAQAGQQSAVDLIFTLSFD
jgi:translocation and assembly module TamB